MLSLLFNVCSGAYRGPAHQSCNVNFQDSRTIPVILHNLTGYEMHFLVEDIRTSFDGQVELLALNMEKYIPITKHLPDRLHKGQTAIRIRFIDSFRLVSFNISPNCTYLIEVLKMLIFLF